ncbi:MAG TPA: 3-carboxy-cis,cis-muconate cycloisomerase [Verrucomicrobiae bacterium]|nr:3-carboxy-cis,cis-muconate cycloisomerase [Verrucomicrobiae bacterium]
MPDPSASTEEMDRLFQPRSRLLAMAAFEAALAAASADAGVVPKAAAAVIADVCASESFDADEIFAAQRLAGNPAIPFIRQLTERVGRRDAAAAVWVHVGATSQDVIDSATMLLARDALAILQRDLQRLRDGLALLAAREAETPMIGRTLLQQAIPISLGFKLAGWLAGLDRAANGLAELTDCALALQFGGPAGTLAAFGEDGPAVARKLAAHLGLPCPAFAWHTERSRFAEIGAWLGILTGLLGKIAGDIILAMQTEVAELGEPAAAGKGGSSAMPHKRNPVMTLFAVAAATRTPHLVGALFACLAQEHERAAGAWHAEWPLLPQLFGHAHAATLAVLDTVEGLEIDAAAMARNLEATGGLIYAERLTAALAPHLGKGEAQRLVEVWCREAVAAGQPLADIAESHRARHAPALTAEELRDAFDPADQIAAAARAVEAMLRQRE